jgi:DNA-binding CsgD family transcriptional regulator
MTDFNVIKLISQLNHFQESVYAHDTDILEFPKDSFMNEFSYGDNTIKLIFNHVTNKVLFISGNAEKLGGYELDKYYKLGLLSMLKILTIEHYDFAHRWWQWAYETHLKYKIDLRTRQALCGVKLSHKDGQIRRVMLRQVGLKTNENGITTTSAITIDDVTHLMKAGFYWGRMDTGKTDNQFHHLISTGKKAVPTDILSDREKDILHLLAQGKESKEIGQIMFISPHTVANHRQNMMNKLGAKDTSCLIQLCRMVGII